MSEIEKLMQNAGIEPIPLFSTRYGYEEGNYYMPPFTAEKQLELIKWLGDTDYYIHNIYKTIDTREYCIENDFYDIQTDKFEKTLARLINKLWIDLTEEEKAEIKRILE